MAGGYLPVLRQQPSSLPDNNIVVDRTDKVYAFDTIFHQHTQQEHLMEAVAPSNLLDSVVGGHCASLLVYGQSGSGKSYTLFGTPEQPGLVSHCAEHIFRRRTDWDPGYFTVSISLVELYQERVRDLLHPQAEEVSMTTGVGSQRVELPGITERPLQHPEDLFTLAQSLGPGPFAGHVLVLMTVETTEPEPGGMLVSTAGKLVLAELAAFGRGIGTETKVNTALLALKQVVSDIHNREKHIPFRNSKLTRLLQNSMAMCSIVCHISASERYITDTNHTLSFSPYKPAVEKIPRPRGSDMPQESPREPRARPRTSAAGRTLSIKMPAESKPRRSPSPSVKQFISHTIPESFSSHPLVPREHDCHANLRMVVIERHEFESRRQVEKEEMDRRAWVVGVAQRGQKHIHTARRERGCAERIVAQLMEKGRVTPKTRSSFDNTPHSPSSSHRDSGRLSLS
eukprot:NODE_208_length_2158_cov_57.949265_g179_i0.p1 GENE.NODE_208_length_2158_cov_57.949265_g179_i0~~NODE_208_length_2158_cov_57.949265_g179_i0.p1  ORF type:complete len:455 (+),score=125.66 NODE_208_length_2158_cov_57.949265_g179_i0:566-1930(+)